MLEEVIEVALLRFEEIEEGRFVEAGFRIGMRMEVE